MVEFKNEKLMNKDIYKYSETLLVAGGDNKREPVFKLNIISIEEKDSNFLRS